MEHAPTQSVNGQPHLTLYDADEHLSFAWSGSLFEDIDVSHGGYGEPVTATIPWTEENIARMQTADGPAAVVRTFGDICSDWTAAQD